MDNDGYKDIYVCNGITHDLTNQDFMDFFANEVMQKMVVYGKKEDMENIVKKMPSTPIPNYAFQNNKNTTFTNQAANWGLDTPSFSNGAAYGDLDNDGDLDMIVNNVNMEAFVYRNNSEKSPKNQYLKVALKGDGQNTFGIGSAVSIFCGNEILKQELVPSRGFQSSVDYKMTFGLGDKKIDSLQVIWPNGKWQILKNVKVNSSINLNIAEATAIYKLKTKTAKALFSESTHNITATTENDYIDFDYEGLISRMLSKEGPATAIGDINGDGNDDIYIGAPKNQIGKIYVSQNNSFSELKQTALSADTIYEDTAAAFFDADNDGDLDLMVGSGGNEKEAQANYRNRLYLNNGKGIFMKSTATIPTTNNNIAVIAPNDFDNDGDVDVFIGSRSVPGIYGISPKHLLLENDGKGNFTNIIDKKAFKVNEIGMITDAVWEDIDGDAKKDLIVVGDWMAPQIFKNTGRRLAPIKSNLSEMSGYWNAVSCVDLNNDGKKDLVLGNRGSNFSYKTTAQNPMNLFVNDFDANGTIEQITTQTIDKKDIPIHLKKELSGQIPSIKKKNLSFADYCQKSVQDIFAPEIIANAIQRKAVIQESIVAFNNGKGQFDVQILPKEAQYSSVNTICATDVNNDGILDLILGGNQHDLKPQFGRLDANNGLVLLGSTSKKFIFMPNKTSGINLNGEVKTIQLLKNKNKSTTILAIIKNNKPKIFKKDD